jgi:hypothetical protein
MEHSDTDVRNDCGLSISGGEAQHRCWCFGNRINAVVFVTEKCSFLVLHCIIKVLEFVRVSIPATDKNFPFPSRS